MLLDEPPATYGQPDADRSDGGYAGFTAQYTANFLFRAILPHRLVVSTAEIGQCCSAANTSDAVR